MKAKMWVGTERVPGRLSQVPAKSFCYNGEVAL